MKKSQRKIALLVWGVLFWTCKAFLPWAWPLNNWMSHTVAISLAFQPESSFFQERLSFSLCWLVFWKLWHPFDLLLALYTKDQREGQDMLHKSQSNGIRSCSPMYTNNYNKTQRSNSQFLLCLFCLLVAKRTYFWLCVLFCFHILLFQRLSAENTFPWNSCCLCHLLV